MPANHRLRGPLVATACAVATIGLGTVAAPALAGKRDHRAHGNATAKHKRHHGRRAGHGHGGAQGGSVIILSGDGMGPQQRTLIQDVNYGIGSKRQPMDSLPYSGMLSTTPNDPEAAVTDSAAGATAWAIGIKTANGHEGVDRDGKAHQTLLEYAAKRGKSTALIEDHDVSNATMAAFASHLIDRDEKDAIIRQYLNRTHPDIMFGGGEKYWYPEGDPGKIPDSIEDPSEGDANYIEKAKKQGYEYAWNKATFKKLHGPKALALVKDDPIQANLYQGFPLTSQYYVSSHEKVAKALQIMRHNRKGFFMIIDFDEIDDGGHDHDGRVIARSGQELNRTVQVIRRYQRSHPNTLLVTTADHETGGMTIEDLSEPQTDTPPDDPVPDEDDSSTADNITLPGSLFPPASGPFRIKGTSTDLKVDWTTPEHTGSQVEVTAAGPLAHAFSGAHENTYVNKIAKRVLRRR